MQSSLELRYVGSMPVEEFIKGAYGERPLEDNLRDDVKDDIGHEVYRFLVIDETEKRE